MANGDDKTAAEVQAMVDALKEQLVIEKELGEEGLEILKALQKKKELLKEVADLGDEAAKAALKEIDAEEKRLDLLRKRVKEQEDANNKLDASLKNLDGQFDSVLLKVTGIGTGWRTGVLGGIDQAIEDGATMGDVFERFGKSIARTFSLKNLAMSFVSNFIQQTTLAILQVDQARADFVKAAGTALTADQAGMITDLADSQNKFGQTIESTTKNFGTLMQTVSGFRNLTAGTQEELLAATGQFEALGISAEDTGQFINFATKAMGMSGKEAVAMQTRMVGLSREVSASGTQLMQQMQQMEGDLAQFGDNMEQEFVNLALTADKTGASMQDLVGIAKKFDTFKGAAQSVGQLNTLIGKNVLNMKEMVGLSFDERIKMLSKRAGEAGVNFETMGRQRKLAFAAALGTDVATMMKIMNNEVDEQQKKLEDLNLSQEDMNKLAEQATPVMRMLQASLQKFIIALEPIITIVRSVVDEFAKLDKETIQLIGGILLGVFALTKIAAVFQALGTIMTPFKLALGAIGPAGTAAAGGISAIGKSTEASMRGIMAFTGLALGVGLAITAVILSLVLLIKTMDEANAPFKDIALGIMTIAISLGILLLSFKLAALTMPIVAVGAIALALSLGALALALAFIKTEDLQAIATIFENVAEVATGNPFAGWTAGLTSFVEELDNIDVEKFEKLNKVVAPMAKVTAAVSNIDDSNVQAIQEAKGLLTELRLTAEQGGVLAVADALSALSVAFKTKQAMPPMVVKIGEKTIIDIYDKHVGRKDPRKKGAFSSIA